MAAAHSVWGEAYRYFPIKIVYLISIAIFELGSLICGISLSFDTLLLLSISSTYDFLTGVAQNSTTLIVGRAITGLGVAGTFGGSCIIIGVLVIFLGVEKVDG